MNFDVSIIQKYGFILLEGVPIILFLSFASAFFGTLIGMLSVFIRKQSKIGKAIVSAYLDVFRGTPVFVQLFFIYFGLPSLFPSMPMNKLVAAMVVFSLNSGAYLSEIMRAGFDGIDKGQIEAAKALGVSSRNIAMDIIIPQALRKILPALMNEFITLTKETSIVSVIGLNDMMYRFNTIKGQVFSSFELLLVVFIVYYVLNKILSTIGKKIEARLQYD